MIKLGQMVLKGVSCIQNYKIRSNGLERSQQGNTMIIFGQMVLKGGSLVDNTKNRSKALERVNWVQNAK